MSLNSHHSLSRFQMDCVHLGNVKIVVSMHLLNLAEIQQVPNTVRMIPPLIAIVQIRLCTNNLLAALDHQSAS